MTYSAISALQGPTKPTRQRQHTQAGYSLIEVLVAVLLVSIGLLGMAGLSAATFSYNKSAQLRLVGLALVSDYADRARVNVYGYDLGNYAIKIDDTIPSASPTFSASADETVASAAAAAVATYDKNQFMFSVNKRLPSGRAVVTTTATAASRGMTVYLLWKEPTAATGDDLLAAVRSNCPSTVSTGDGYSCISFEVGL